MKRVLLILMAIGIGLAFLVGQSLTAKDPAPPAGASAAAGPAAAPVANGADAAHAADKAAIEAAAQAFAKAFESGDAKSVAALFTDEAEYLSEGTDPIHGRAALGKAYEAFFAKRKPTKAVSKTDAIRFLSPETAIQEGTFTVSAPDSSPDANRFSALYVRQNGKWLIALMEEWEDDAESKVSLTDLAWLIGSWETTGGDVTARTTYEWTASKAFIRVQYSITSKAPADKGSSGVQVIGVDPADGRIRAWLFDSDGGIGESTWLWEGDRWVIESQGTLPDGSRTTAVNFLKRAGDDAFTWRSVERTVAGESEPDIGAVTVKRVKPATTAPKPSR
jgi:uncharacterized protein (TIGR02246 family)